MNFEYKYKKYSKALYSALCEDAFYITLEKSAGFNKSSEEAMLRYMDFSMTEGEKYGVLYIPKDHEYGVSVWSKPLQYELKVQKDVEKKSFLRSRMGEESLKIYNAIVNFMSAKAEPFIDNNFWYLSIVGVLPKFQGQGLGYGLIKHVLQKTDSLKVPTYLETFTPRNMNFYKKLGYQAIESFYEPTTKAKYWLMIRKPLNAQRNVC